MRNTWPPLILVLADELVALAKARGLRGRVIIRQRKSDGTYYVALEISAAQTVSAHH